MRRKIGTRVRTRSGQTGTIIPDTFGVCDQTEQLVLLDADMVFDR